MRTLRSRVGTFAGLALAGTLAFTACGDGEQAEELQNDPDQVEAADQRSEADAQMKPGGAEILDQVPELEFTELEQDDTTVVSAFGKQLSVTQTVQTTTLPAEVAEQITGTSGDFEEGALVSAADGETFVVSVLQVDDPRWEPAEESVRGSSEADTTLRVQGNPLTDPYLDVSAGDQVTVEVAMPEEPQAEDVTVELVQDDGTQEISLVDGTRVASDVEHIYDRPTTVEIGDGASWSEDGESRRGTVTMSGQLTDGMISPMVPDYGWANPGQVLLGLNLTTQELGDAHRDHSTIRLELEDGTTVQPESETRGVDGPFSNTAWFQLPADATEATALISVDMVLGTTDHHVADLEVPLTFSTDNGDTGDESETEEAETEES